MSKPRWKSRIRWDENHRTTHDGRTYELITHSYHRGKAGWSGTDTWHLHEVLGNGNTHPEPLSIPLGENRRRAQRLAELWILGWRNAPGTRSPEYGYREMWRASDGTLHPIADVLTGQVPHAPNMPGSGAR